MVSKKAKAVLSSKKVKTDVLIVGSGPAGATFAAEIHRLRPDVNIVMIDAGALESAVPGSHKRNAFDYQKDVDRFGHVIQGALSPVSVPVSTVPATTLDPFAFAPWGQVPLVAPQFLPRNQNPDQQPEVNLAAESITRVVGGMATHWTCVCPRLQPGLGRPVLELIPAADDAAWNDLYNAAEALLGVVNNAFNNSLRQAVILGALQAANPGRGINALPLACHRLPNQQFVNWHSAHTILTGAGNPNPFQLAVLGEYGNVVADHFELRPNVLCTELISNAANNTIDAAICHNLHDDTYFEIEARIYIIAAGAVSTPQLLTNSAIGNILPALGQFLTDHTMAFCQIVLNQNIVNGIANNIPPTQFWPQVQQHMLDFPNDPVAIPYNDPEPQIWVPAAVATPWQGQIQRDAFHGAVPDNMEPRIVVDFRFYGQIIPNANNMVMFNPATLDPWGMPRPTFNVNLNNADRLAAHAMMADMVQIAGALGGFLPGAEPRFMERGSVPHLSGTTRAEQPGVPGQQGAATCVVDVNSQVLGVNNLFLGGNGVIPTAFAANPTLTSVAYAVRSAAFIAGLL